jgi:hypothetical protein
MTDWTKYPVSCSECGAALSRYLFRPKDHKRIERFFCDRVCKGRWQEKQHPVSDEWLKLKYVTEGLDCVQIGAIVGRDAKSVWTWLKIAKIPTRPRGSDKRQHFVKGQKNPFEGCRHTEETKAKMRAIALADGRVPYDPAVGSYMKGRKGALATNWKGGITAERQAFYATEEWREAVKCVWKRADAKCERCGINHNTTKRRGTFDIHHIVGFAARDLRSVTSNLALLCEPCHMFVHSKKNINRDFIGEIKNGSDGASDD